MKWREGIKEMGGRKKRGGSGRKKGEGVEEERRGEVVEERKNNEGRRVRKKGEGRKRAERCRMLMKQRCPDSTHHAEPLICSDCSCISVIG